MNDKELYTIWLPKELKANLKKEAQAKGLTHSSFIIILLNGKEK